MNKKILIFAIALIFLVSSISLVDAWCFFGIGNTCEKGKRIFNIGREISREAREDVKPIVRYHLECQNQQCVEVSGYGANECSSNADCVQPIEEEDTLPNGTIISVIAVGDTLEGVTLTGVDANGNSCNVEYQGLTYTISELGIRVFENEMYKIIGVLDAIQIDDPASPDYCKLVMGQGDLVMAYATNETMSGVTLIGVDANGNSCTMGYQGLTYTILKNKLKIMPDERIIAVEDAIQIDDPSSPDYCRLWLYGVRAEEIPDGACNQVWFNANGLITRNESYDPVADICVNSGYRPYYGNKMVGASCFNINECNSGQWIGECKNRNQLMSLCEGTSNNSTMS